MIRKYKKIYNLKQIKNKIKIQFFFKLILKYKNNESLEVVEFGAE